MKKTKKSLEAQKTSLKKTKDTSLVWDDTNEKEYVAVCNDLDIVSKRYDEAVEKSKATSDAVKETEPTTGNFVVLKVVGNGGVRFDPMTGKKNADEETITLSLSEWRLFKENHKILGYTVTGVVADPFGDAKDIIE